MKFALISSAALLLALTSPATAQVAMHGSFDATKACPALQSIKKRTNPGNMSVEVEAIVAIRAT